MAAIYQESGNPFTFIIKLFTVKTIHFIKNYFLKFKLNLPNKPYLFLNFNFSIVFQALNKIKHILF